MKDLTPNQWNELKRVAEGKRLDHRFVRGLLQRALVRPTNIVPSKYPARGVMLSREVLCDSEFEYGTLGTAVEFAMTPLGWRVLFTQDMRP